jgi:hypothetical protein
MSSTKRGNEPRIPQDFYETPGVADRGRYCLTYNYR